MKRNSKQFLALFMAVAMSVTPVSYAYAEDSAVAGVENTESDQQTVEVTDGKIGAADAADQPAEEVTGQEEETTAGQGTEENQKSQEEPKEENAATGNVTEAEKKEAGEDGKSEEKISEWQDVKTEETAQNAGEVNTQEEKNVISDFAMFKVGSSSVVKENDHLKVSIETENTTYNKIYIGSKADTVERKEEKAIVGTGTSKGYLFTFELPLSADGTDVAFVPHSQENGWESRKADGDYTLHISSSAENKKDDTENPEQGGNSGESKPETGSGENQKPGNEDKTVLNTGKYVVDVDAASASGMFRVVNCVLTSVCGKMQADITLSGTVLAVLAIIWLFPIAWVILTSFRAEKGSYVSTFFPKAFTLDNYIKLFTDTSILNFPQMFMNTLFIAICSCILSAFYVLAVSYCLSRLKFKMRKPYMNMAMILGLFPGFMSMIAVYFILKAMGLTEGNLIKLALILCYSGGAGLGFQIAKGFFDTIPVAIDEAALLDGCTRWQIFSKITLPLSKPIIVYTVLTSFMAPWLDFIFAKVICRANSDQYTIAIGLWKMLEKEYIDSWYTSFAAGAVLISIPIAILFLFMQRYYVDGVSGAVKG